MVAHVAESLMFPLTVFSLLSFRFLMNYFLLWGMLSHPLNKVQMEICGGSKMDPRLLMSGMTELELIRGKFLFPFPQYPAPAGWPLGRTLGS